MSKPSRMEILELLSNGKITAAEAANLLSSAAEPAVAGPVVAEKAPPPPVEKAPAPPPTSATGEKEPNWFHVRVANLETGKNRVTVNIPIRMMKFGLKIGSRFSPEIENMDWNELTGMMKDMTSGMLVDVQDEDSNEHVQVYLD
jgi:hypothetical protein